MIFLCPLLHFATSCRRFAIDPNLTEITQVRNHFCLGIIGLYERDSLSVYIDALIVIIPFLSKKEKSLFEYLIRVDCWLTLLCPINVYNNYTSVESLGHYRVIDDLTSTCLIYESTWTRGVFLFKILSFRLIG